MVNNMLSELDARYAFRLDIGQQKIHVPVLADLKGVYCIARREHFLGLGQPECRTAGVPSESNTTISEVPQRKIAGSNKSKCQ